MYRHLPAAAALLVAASLLPACAGGATSGASAATSAATSSTSAASVTSAAAEPAAADEENYTTGDASLDNPRNADGIGEDELMVVSFGTSFNDSRRLTIGGIEAALEKAFPDWSVRRGFTSQIIIDHVKSRDGADIDNVKQALDRATAADNLTATVEQAFRLL